MMSVNQSQKKSEDNSRTEIELDPNKIRAFRCRISDEQRVLPAVLGGFLTAFLGAVLWTLITIMTAYQINWIAIGVGASTGWVVRKMGRGVSIHFGFISVGCAFFGCILGVILSSIGSISINNDASFFTVFAVVVSEPSVWIEMIQQSLQPLDYLFMGIALILGYRLSFRTTSIEEIRRLQ